MSKKKLSLRCICDRVCTSMRESGETDAVAVTIDLCDLVFLLECVQDLANCLDQNAEEVFYECITGEGKYDRHEIQIMGNLLNRADSLRASTKELAGEYGLELSSGK